MKSNSSCGAGGNGRSYIGSMNAKFYLNGAVTHTFEATSIYFNDRAFSGSKGGQTIYMTYPERVLEGVYEFEYVDGDGGGGYHLQYSSGSKAYGLTGKVRVAASNNGDVQEGSISATFESDGRVISVEATFTGVYSFP